jgi:hypothetical protein
MTSSGADYNPTFVECTGFGQNTSNTAPSLFLESLAIDLDCSVYGSLFVTNNGTFDGNVTVQKDINLGGSIFASGTINGGSNANFSGTVSAAGGFISGNPMRLPNASIGGALNQFGGAMDVNGLLKTAGGIASGGEITGPLMQAAEKFVIGQQPGTEEISGTPTPPAQFYLNQQRYIPKQIFDNSSGEYITVLAATTAPPSDN